MRLPSQGTCAQKRSPHNTWLWKPVRIASERNEGLWKTRMLFLEDSLTNSPHAPGQRQQLEKCLGHTGRNLIDQLSGEGWRGGIGGNSLWGWNYWQMPLYHCALLLPGLPSASRHQICPSPLTWLTSFALAQHSSEILPCTTCLPWLQLIPSLLLTLQMGGGQPWPTVLPFPSTLEPAKVATKPWLALELLGRSSKASICDGQFQLKLWPFPSGHKPGTGSSWPQLAS